MDGLLIDNGKFDFPYPLVAVFDSKNVKLLSLKDGNLTLFNTYEDLTTIDDRIAAVLLFDNVNEFAITTSFARLLIYKGNRGLTSELAIKP
jgi:uncharacterized heparinase superfamily protein